MTFSNREHGYIDRLQERMEILRARVKNAVHRAHYVIDWEREMKALEWALNKINSDSGDGGE